MKNPYLETTDDGLPMRESNDYAKDKLRILEAYVDMFITSMHGKKWRSINYIDLMAGPGKNKFSPSGEIMLGSPMIALSARHAFSNYWFVELSNTNFSALQKRTTAHPRGSAAMLLNGDANIKVDSIVSRIEEIDQEYIEGSFPSLNLAFIDPEGLELRWETVEKLARMKRMDFIINFSTSGFTRNANQMFEMEQETKLDTFFGTTEWRKEYRKVANRDNSHVRRMMIDFYKDRLTQVDPDYNYHEKDIVPSERVFKNTRGAQVYTLIAASKHKLGDKFWKQSINRTRQRKLF